MPRTVTTKPASTYHHGDLREALIDAAVRAAERGGQEAVNFTALARELGVSQAAPYRHFTDRAALLAEVGERGFRSYIAMVRKALAVEDGRSRIGRMAHAYKDFGLAKPGLYHVMFASGIMPAAELGSPLKQATKATFEIVLDCLNPALEDTAKRRFGLKIWASVHGIVTMVEQGLLPPPAHSHITVESLVDDLVADLELAMEATVAKAGPAAG